MTTNRISTKPARRTLSMTALCAGLIAAMALLACGKESGESVEPAVGSQPAGDPAAPAQPDPAAPPQAGKPSEAPATPADPAAPPESAEPPVPAQPADPSAPPPTPAAPEPAEPVQPAEPEKADKPGEPGKADSPGKPEKPKPMTAEECTAAGGTLAPSTGGAPKCPKGTVSIGTVRHGIEGAACCK
jgi:hypothetical protein